MKGSSCSVSALFSTEIFIRVLLRQLKLRLFLCIISTQILHSRTRSEQGGASTLPTVPQCPAFSACLFRLFLAEGARPPLPHQRSSPRITVTPDRSRSTSGLGLWFRLCRMTVCSVLDSETVELLADLSSVRCDDSVICSRRALTVTGPFSGHNTRSDRCSCLGFIQLEITRRGPLINPELTSLHLHS
ncbi:hypothetical protein SRHO_G00034450 [Serrasalmus rhombeus]